jgi:hypothetical protein
VLHMPPSLRALGAVLNPVASFLPVPRVPAVGRPITYLSLFDPVCGGPHGSSLLKPLIGQLQRNAHADGVDILTLFAYRDGRLVQWPRFLLRVVLHYHTMALPVRPGTLPPEKPLYLDIRDI